MPGNRANLPIVSTLWNPVAPATASTEYALMCAPADITPLTYLDYPGKAACIFWFRGCNLRCPYCYNPEFIIGDSHTERADWTDFLRERQGFLDAVVMSGGEASLHPDIIPICRTAKELGYLVKIDTNGSNPAIIRQLLAEDVIDYVAVDHKMPSKRSSRLSDGAVLFDRFCETVAALQKANIPHEIRTTCHPALLNEQDLVDMSHEIKNIGYDGTYGLQYFFETKETLGHMQKPERRYDRSWLNEHSALPLCYRNFPEERYAVNPTSVSV